MRRPLISDKGKSGGRPRGEAQQVVRRMPASACASCSGCARADRLGTDAACGRAGDGARRLSASLEGVPLVLVHEETGERRTAVSDRLGQSSCRRCRPAPIDSRLNTRASSDTPSTCSCRSARNCAQTSRSTSARSPRPLTSSRRPCRPSGSVRREPPWSRAVRLSVSARWPQRPRVEPVGAGCSAGGTGSAGSVRGDFAFQSTEDARTRTATSDGVLKVDPKPTRSASPSRWTPCASSKWHEHARRVVWPQRGRSGQRH